MQQIVHRLTQPGRFGTEDAPGPVDDANGRLAPYGVHIAPIEIHQDDQDGQPLWRPVELLEAAGSATIGSLEAGALTPTRRLATLWGIVRYVADLESAGCAIQLTDDGLRYRGVARGALSADLGVAWSALITASQLAPGSAFLDIEHAGREHVRRVQHMPGVGRRSMPDFVALNVGGDVVDLIEAKGRTGHLNGERLASAARQLIAMEAAPPRTTRHRYITTIRGKRHLVVGVYAVQADPAGPIAQGAPGQPPDGDDPGEPDGGGDEPAELDQRTNERIVSAPSWFAGPDTDGTEWEGPGYRYRGLEATTTLGTRRLVVRQGVAVELLAELQQRLAEPPVQRVERWRSSIRRRMRERGPSGMEVLDTARGAVASSARRLTAVSELGTVLDLEVAG